MAKTKKSASPKKSSKKTAAKKASKKAVAKWKVECSEEGTIGRFATKSQAEAERESHMNQTGHEVKVIGRQ